MHVEAEHTPGTEAQGRVVEHKILEKNPQLREQFLLQTFGLGIGRATKRTASLALSATSRRSPGGATGLCCFRLVLGQFLQKRGHPAARDAKPF